MGSSLTEPAYKVRISEILEGEFESISVDHVRYFRFKWGSAVKVRVLGMVISTWVHENRSFAKLDLFDGTGIIQLRAWEDGVDKLVDEETGELYARGSILDVIAKIRSWKDKPYLSPLIVLKVKDPNLVLLRELEVIRRDLRFSSLTPVRSEKNLEEELLKLLREVDGLSQDEIADLMGEERIKVSGALSRLRELGLIYEEDGRYYYIG